VLKPLCHAQTHSLEQVTGLESGFNSLSLQQQAASRLIIYAGSAGHAGLLGLKLMTLTQWQFVIADSSQLRTSRLALGRYQPIFYQHISIRSRRQNIPAL